MCIRETKRGKIYIRGEESGNIIINNLMTRNLRFDLKDRMFIVGVVGPFSLTKMI